MTQYPATERGLQGDVDSLRDVEEHILPHLSSKRVAIQAGGAVGLWAKKLAEYFDFVFAFEPNPELRDCFHANTHGIDNILLYPFALGADVGECKVSGNKPHNMGSWWVQEGKGSFMVPLDDFAFANVDLLMLDIEGGELNALKGALGTIIEEMPAIVVETKEQCMRKFGYTKSDLHKLLKSLEYELHSTFHGERDELWLPIR